MTPAVADNIRDADDPLIRSEFEHMIRIAQIPEDTVPTLCTFDHAHVGAGDVPFGFKVLSGPLEGKLALLWPSTATFTDAERRGVMAHEIAHVRLGHTKKRFEGTRLEYIEREVEVDALAAQWVGVDNVRAALDWCVRLAETKDHWTRDFILEEVLTRIQRLHKND